MKLRIALALAALAAAGTVGVAFAQDAGQATGVLPDPTASEAQRGGMFARQGINDASRQIHFACALDMHKLCAGKAGSAADRCLVYHRMSFSPSCKTAITNFERAIAPLGPEDSVAHFGPYSRYQARAEPPASGWLYDPRTVRTANGS